MDNELEINGIRPIRVAIFAGAVAGGKKALSLSEEMELSKEEFSIGLWLSKRVKKMIASGHMPHEINGMVIRDAISRAKKSLTP